MPLLPGPEVSMMPVLLTVLLLPMFVLIAAELTVVIVPVLTIKFCSPVANMLRELLPTVDMRPVLRIVLLPFRARIASEPMLPVVLIVPLFFIVFAPPAEETPIWLSPLAWMLPVEVIIKVSLPLSSGLVGP